MLKIENGLYKLTGICMFALGDGSFGLRHIGNDNIYYFTEYNKKNLKSLYDEDIDELTVYFEVFDPHHCNKVNYRGYHNNDVVVFGEDYSKVHRIEKL